MELKDQGVDEVSKFILKKDGKEIKTNTLFVTFCTPTPPPKLKIGYYNVEVKLYIPNPLRCFDCQEFGHSRKYCKKQLKCWKCGKEGHDGSECTSETLCCVKAILQVLIYTALYDKSYLGSKTTMTSGEWTCLISFATAPLTCSERGGSEKFKMKIYVSSGIRTHTPPVHDRKVAAP